ncbi:MAG: type VI secretion system baseplate subunit TssF [candidate division Zixibacteria bacterium]|nr:type VI secretion system baseplate subunit TssF [candidate division Zixibacteria bacterium]
MFNKYYQDELSYLREMGQEFARAHPQVAHMLAETGTDPDVERLLEGFAFLTGRIRQRLDSELPELTHALVGLLWPHYLRPIPALSIVQFTGKAALQETQVIPRGASMESAPVDGVPCRFRTTADVRLYPFVLEGAELRAPLAQPASLRLKFAAASQVNLAGLDLGPLRLFLHGEPTPVSTLYLWLCRHVRAVTLRSGSQEARLPDGAITAAGFDDGEALWPYPTDAPGGYRLLQEFFALPERFHFVDVHDLRPLRDMEAADRFELVIEFASPPPDDLRFKPELLRLACVPVVNLMPLRSTPIRIDHEKTEYRLRPDVANAAHYEIFSVDSVVGWEQGTVRERGYRPFFSYEHSPPDEAKIGDYYQVRLRPATGGAGTDTYIAFAADVIAGAMPPPETIACELTCTNRNLPEKLRPGDISVPTSESPAFAEFRNLTRVTPSVSPPLEDRLLWYLISHWSLNYQTLGKIEALRGILSVYNMPALVDRQAQRTHELRLAGLESVQVRPDEILRRGALYRGLDIELEMREDHFAAEGEMFLFASVLNRFFNLFATCNAFTRLRVRGRQKGSVMTWEPILGQQPLL